MKRILVTICFLWSAIFAGVNCSNLHEDSYYDEIGRVLGQLGFIYLKQEKFDLASKYVKAAILFCKKLGIDNSKHYADIWSEGSYILGTLYCVRNKMNKAEEQLKQLAGQVCDYRIEALCALAVLYEDLGDLSLSETYLNQAMDEDAEVSLYKLARIAKQMGKLDLAEKYYKKDGAQYYLGRLYEKMGKLSLAEACYQEVLNDHCDQDCDASELGFLEDTNIRPLNRLGVVYYKQGKFELSKQCFLQALEKFQRSSTVRCNLMGRISLALGFVYEDLNQPDQAEYYFKKCDDLCYEYPIRRVLRNLEIELDPECSECCRDMAEEERLNFIKDSFQLAMDQHDEFVLQVLGKLCKI